MSETTKASPELIAWEDVPQGHMVWFKRKDGGLHWLHGQRRGSILFDHDGGERDESKFIFARAEQ